MPNADRDETPPWHPYCGCAGCRSGEAAFRRFVQPRLQPAQEENDD